MSKSFSLNQLTEGIRQRHLGSQNRRLVEKWARTGLLRGLDGVTRENMARMLENQAGQLLKEASSASTGGGNLTSSGDLRGFSNIAFPIVRRVFGGLVANDLVSVQPMSLPSGLLFYLDYTYGSKVGVAADDGTSTAVTYATGSSIYNNPAGKGVQSGSTARGGQYDLAGSGFSKVHTNTTALPGPAGATNAFKSGTFGGGGPKSTSNTVLQAPTAGALSTSGTDGRFLQFDPQISNKIDGDGDVYSFVFVRSDHITSSNGDAFDSTMIKDLILYDADDTSRADIKTLDTDIQDSTCLNIRRLNQLVTIDGSSVVTSTPLASLTATTTYVLFVVSGSLSSNNNNTTLNETLQITFPIGAKLTADSSNADSLVIPSFESDFGATPSPAIPEIDIKVESIPVVANTRKLRAKWSPELAQDLNAYHSLDAEVELTQILSEQIALELDREILNDLLTQASGANLFWSRAPGRFVNKETGVEALKSDSLAGGPAFTGTVREWYETLVETIIDVGNQIHRKTLRGAANFVVVGPDVATIFEASVYYRPAYGLDGDGQVSAPMTIGCEKVGTLSNRFTVYKDPYFPRNKVLVGYKGGSYLETGFVYAPYVPLIVTPTIFAPEDFTPRKGVMTRYGKKMVRSDFYGTVTVLDLNII